MTKRRQPRRVEVRWIDAAMSAAPHWSDGSRPKRPSGPSMHLCLTVGWLVHADKEWLQIVSTITDGAHAHLTEIPRGMVRAITLLADAGDLME